MAIKPIHSRLKLCCIKMNKEEITIRPMADEDVPAASAIVCAGYLWLGRAEGYTPEETTSLIALRGAPEAITEQRRDCHFLVAEIDGVVMGVASIRKNEFMKLYIAPDRMRQGIGVALFKSAARLIAGKGYDEVILGAFPSAGGFYEVMGMEKIGERSPTRGPIAGRCVYLYRKWLL